MLVSNKKILLFTAVLATTAILVSVTEAAFDPPGVAPPGGNVTAPIYSTGSQTLTGNLIVTASSGTGISVSGGSAGLVGSNTTTGIQGTLTSDSGGGDTAVYGNAFSGDGSDYSAVFYGGAGVQMTSGDLWFSNQGTGIAWPRESDSASLYGIKVETDGALHLNGHGGGILFRDQTPTTRMTLEEDGDLITTGDITVADNKSIKIENASADTTLLVGNYGDGGGFSYGTNYVADLAVEGSVKGASICIQEDCKTTWASIASNLWTQDGTDLYPNSTSWDVAIGASDPGVYKLYVDGDLHATGDVSAGGADLAEQFETEPNLTPGTVMVMGNNGYRSATPSTTPYDQKVIGVISEDAALVMGRIEGPNRSTVGLVGTVPIKVTNEGGSIAQGDLLTTSSTTGHAMKAHDPQIGTIVGKALESFTGTSGIIHALISLQ